MAKVEKNSIQQSKAHTSGRAEEILVQLRGKKRTDIIKWVKKEQARPSEKQEDTQPNRAEVILAQLKKMPRKDIYTWLEKEEERLRSEQSAAVDGKQSYGIG